MTEFYEKNTLKISLELGKGILVESNGDSAKIVAFGAAIALATASVAVGYAVHGVKHIVSRRLKTAGEAISDSKNRT